MQREPSEPGKNKQVKHPAGPAPHSGVTVTSGPGQTVIDCSPDEVALTCRDLAVSGHTFATLVVEEQDGRWRLHYIFYKDRGDGLVRVAVAAAGAKPQIKSICTDFFAADWHERECEDLFGLSFAGHPRLGDFVLHEHWAEGVNPMRSDFDGGPDHENGELGQWQPPRIVKAPGAFMMPIGPVYSDYAEAAHFLLETVGEDVIRVIPRFFYKYRGVEKTVQGHSADEALLLAERFSGTSAFGHSLAFCQSLETICNVQVPPRALALRTFWAEFERCRHHLGVIADICSSTALVVAASQMAILEEEMLRLSCRDTGHRYLFGLNVCGGLSQNLGDDLCLRLSREVDGIIGRLSELFEKLRFTSSFLDRLEQVGAISLKKARDYGLVGPIARASGVARDLRCILPYAFYDEEASSFTVPCKDEGDGYARLRVFFDEIVASGAIMRRLAGSLPPGQIRSDWSPRAGASLGWAETPAGASFCWLRIDDNGQVARCRLTPPSFTNWHGFHLAAEDFAFQDFPIIMATFGLTNAECDR